MSGDSTDTTDAGKDSKAADDTATKETATKDGADNKDAAGKPKDADDHIGLKKALQAERKQREQLEKQIRDGELAKLPELERAQAVAQELTQENERLKLENTRQKVALDMGLPWKLAKRLSGETEDEMRQDAADLLKDYKPAGEQVVKDDPKNKKPPNDAKKTGSSGGPDMNQILRALAGKKG